jgi:membrane-associated protease RseP (regulator of RpoE activity)
MNQIPPDHPRPEDDGATAPENDFRSDSTEPIDAEPVIWAELVEPQSTPSGYNHGYPPGYQVPDYDINPNLVPDYYQQVPPQRNLFERPRRVLPAILFVATCLTTVLAGWQMNPSLVMALWYAVPLMTILTFHEMGHFLQARRYRVPASWPFFIPMPLGFIGTMGAVIGMASNQGDRKQLFDIGITGPLAGLVPTLICCVIGIHYSTIEPVANGAIQFGDPLLLKLLVYLQLGPIPAGHDVALHPIGFAGWVGLLITSLNLIPIGQLDGGHVLYALLLKRAHIVAKCLLYGALILVAIYYPPWIVMILLLIIMGPEHPPTADDQVPLGRFRIILGWLTLAFIFVGFTPMPFKL